MKDLINTSFAEALKDVGIHVVDVETTGLDQKDRMFSAAAQSYTITNGQLSSPKTTEGFFNVLSNKVLKPASSFPDRESHIQYIEKKLQQRHSDSEFGRQQLDRGSLRQAAEAYVDNNLTTSNNFLKQLNNNLSPTNSNLLLTHNSNFESRVFEEERTLSKHQDGFKSLESRNISNSLPLFRINSETTDLKKKSTQYYNDVLHHALEGNQTELKASLGEYASSQARVIDSITAQIQLAKKTGSTVAVDSMDLSRALMSFAAVNGDVDVHNLRAGDKVEHQVAHFFPGEKELHTAAGDSEQQGRLFKLLTDEIDKYKTNPNYRSPLMQSYNTYLNKEEAALKNIKASMGREVKDVISGKKKLGDYYEWKNKNLERSNLLPRKQRAEARDYIEGFNDTVEDSNTDKELAKNTKDYDKNYTFNKNKRTTSDLKDSTKSKVDKVIKSMSGKKKIMGGVALLGAANLVLGGKKEQQKKPNTYNELYDNVYYGSALADWQDRNNSHKVLY